MGKYFKYAIGEIILVVIGILIALQINNWNEDKKATKQENQLYTKMLIDLEDEIKLLQEVDSSYLRHDEVHYNLYETAIGKAKYNANLSYGLLRWNISFSPTFKDNYQNKMDQIHDDAINKSVLNYFRVQEQTEKVVGLFEKSKADLLRPYLTKNNIMNLNTIFSSDEKEKQIDPKYSINYTELKKHIKNPEFIHILTDLRLKTEAGNRNIGYLKQANIELQQVIKKHLN